MIINVISSPRNISTALMYSFANRNNTFPIDEPFYAYYLSVTGAKHPGRDEILNSQSTDYLTVVDEIYQAQKKHKHVFVKNMAHHLIGTDISFIKEWKNVFLIRNPKQQIASFAQVIPNPKQSDIGIKRQFELFNYLKESNINAEILDSGILLSDPSAILTKLCQALDLDMQESMLSWKPRQLDEDGIWAKYWYENVHKSTGFSKQKTSSRELPENCKELFQESLFYYNQLLTTSIQ